MAGGAASGLAFPGRNPVQPMTTRQLNRACYAAADRARDLLLYLRACLPKVVPKSVGAAAKSAAFSLE